MIALAEATAEHIAAKRKEHRQAMKNQCPSCGQDMREEPREDCPQCGQSSPAPALLAQLDTATDALRQRTTERDALRDALQGCHDMLRECAKQFRCTNDNGHATMADLHANQAQAALAQKGPL